MQNSEIELQKSVYWNNIILFFWKELLSQKKCFPLILKNGWLNPCTVTQIYTSLLMFGQNFNFVNVRIPKLLQFEIFGTWAISFSSRNWSCLKEVTIFGSMYVIWILHKKNPWKNFLAHFCFNLTWMMLWLKPFLPQVHCNS